MLVLARGSPGYFDPTRLPSSGNDAAFGLDFYGRPCSWDGTVQCIPGYLCVTPGLRPGPETYGQPCLNTEPSGEVPYDWSNDLGPTPSIGKVRPNPVDNSFGACAMARLPRLAMSTVDHFKPAAFAVSTDTPGEMVSAFCGITAPVSVCWSPFSSPACPTTSSCLLFHGLFQLFCLSSGGEITWISMPRAILQGFGAVIHGTVRLS
jgi:hypothetical protein